MNKNEIEKIVKDMVKPLYLTFDNGEVFVVDGHFVADDAAKYYSKGSSKNDDPKLQDEDSYDCQYDWMINDFFELDDWMKNNMNWEDLDATYIGKHLYDYHDKYVNESEVEDKINLDELSY